MFTLMLTTLIIAHVPESDGCICAEGRVSGGWCSPCKIGYVAGFSIPSKMLYSAIETYGHEANPETFTCKTCRVEVKRDGFCARCHTGWVTNRAYFSRLAYLLAKGDNSKRVAISCKLCRTNSERSGWCKRCAQGMVGTVVLKNRSEFEEASKAMELAFEAIQELERCEVCAVAMIIDGYCSACKLYYHKGKPSRRNERNPPKPAETSAEDVSPPSSGTRSFETQSFMPHLPGVPITQFSNHSISQSPVEPIAPKRRSPNVRLLDQAARTGERPRQKTNEPAERTNNDNTSKPHSEAAGTASLPSPLASTLPPWPA